MKGTSELASDDEIKKSAMRTESRGFTIGFAIDGGLRRQARFNDLR